MRYATNWRRFAPSASGSVMGPPLAGHGGLGDSASSMWASRLAGLLLRLPPKLREVSPAAIELARRPFAGQSSEDADAVDRPIGRKNLADDPREPHRTPVAAVVGVAPVVTQHVVLAARNDDRVGHVAAAGVGARRDVGLVCELLAVDHRMPVP